MKFDSFDNYSVPDSWRFTPIRKDSKAPIGTGWQEKPFTWSDCPKPGAFYKGQPVGAVGILFEHSHLVGVDFDGFSAETKLSEWGVKLPPTTTITSGRPGRRLEIYKLPKAYRGVVESRSFITKPKVIDEFGREKDEQLEIFVRGQSLVYGTHPDTKKPYRVLNWVDPEQIPELPQELIYKILKSERGNVPKTGENDTELARELLNFIPLGEFCWEQYRDFLFACHSAGLSESEVLEASRKSPKHNDKGFYEIWRHIKGRPGITIASLVYWAKQNGWESKTKHGTDEPPELVTRQDVEAILKVGCEFDINQLFPEVLANAFKSKARSLNLPPVIFAGTFLPIAAGLIPHRLQLSHDYTVPSVLWMAQVGESGTAKSAVISILKSPLDALQSAEYDIYKERKWQWQNSKPAKNETPEKPPTRKFYYVQDSTTESLAIALEARPSIAVISDELTGFIKGLNQYKNGKGNDRQKWLTLYDAGALDTLRKSEQLHIKRAAVSLLGGIQPQVLAQVIQGDTDLSDGFWSRFCWLNIPLTELPLTGQFDSVSVGELLTGIYKQLSANDEPKIYKLTNGALQVLQSWERKCEQSKMQEPNNFIRALFPKARQRAARIALILHCIAAAVNQQPPGDYVQQETMAAAVAFSEWLLQQARLVFSDCGYTDSPEANRVAKFIKRFDGMEVTPRAVRNWWTAKTKPSAQCTRDFMQKIVSLGYGKVIRGTASQSDYTIQVWTTGWTNGLPDGLPGSPRRNADEYDNTGGDGLPDYQNMEKTGEGVDESNLGKKGKKSSPVVHTYLEVPSDGGFGVDYLGSPCVVHQSIRDNSTHHAENQHNISTEVCEIAAEFDRHNPAQPPPGDGWLWFPDESQPGGGEWAHTSECEITFYPEAK